MPLRTIFMGTPAFAVPTLTEVVGQGHEVAAVYTRPPAPAGRGMHARKSAVHEAAERFGLEVLHPRTLRDPEAQERFRSFDADVAVVVAYGLLLPDAVLEAPREGCFNLHPSLLPRWRGAAPVQRAIMAGDVETGVAVMKIDEGLDSGPVAMVERYPIPPEATAAEVEAALARLGADLMARALGAIERGALTLTPQPEEEVTYAEKISKAEAKVDWSRPARRVHDHIRGLSPFPGAWCEMPASHGPERLKLLRSVLTECAGAPGEILDDRLTVACGAGAVRLVEVQRAGKAAMPAEAFLRGAHLPPGTRFG